MTCMKKTLTVLGVIAALLLASLVVVELIGFRFDPKNVFFPNDGWNRVIDADDWLFYYYTFPIEDDDGLEADEYIEGFRPVRRYGFLYKTLNEYAPDYRVYTADSDEYVGTMYRFDGKDRSNYIFSWSHSFSSDSFAQNWLKSSKVTVNGQELDLVKKSFFSTGDEFTSFSIGECELNLAPYTEER